MLNAAFNPCGTGYTYNKKLNYCYPKGTKAPKAAKLSPIDTSLFESTPVFDDWSKYTDVYAPSTSPYWAQKALQTTTPAQQVSQYYYPQAAYAPAMYSGSDYELMNNVFGDNYVADSLFGLSAGEVNKSSLDKAKDATNLAFKTFEDVLNILGNKKIQAPTNPDTGVDKTSKTLLYAGLTIGAIALLLYMRKK